MNENDFLELSDEEILAMGDNPVLPGAGEAGQSADGAGEQNDAAADNQTQVADGAAAAGETDAAATATTDASGQAGDSQAADAASGDATKAEGAAEEGASTEGAEAGATAAPFDYEAEYKRLTAPFKANGREVQPKSTEDAIALMQMGANYNKRMAALKPNLKLLKMLENQGLLSEEKLSFLIDLSKKDAGAINKLVQESGLDPLDLGTDKAAAYTRSNYAVQDTEVELDMVLNELEGSSTYTRTLDLVGNKWDAQSKQIVGQNPQLLKVLDGHMASGIYDLISAEVENERVLGRLSGLSDIEAYRQVGDALHARGGFNHLTQPRTAAPAPAAASAGNASQGGKPQAPAVVAPAPKPAATDAALNAKRRAAAGTQRAAPSAAPAADFNPLAMSDAEFLRMAAPKFN